MSNRHIGRTIALQTIFELDIAFSFDCEDSKASEILLRNRDEFAEGYTDTPFALSIVEDVKRRIITLDDIIVRAAPEWPIEKINAVDRNILRLGLSELLFGNKNQVPPKVAIDEAIELAKTFGGETSGKFVNGVLGAIYKELGEPEKHQETKKDTSKNPVENCVGAVVYSIDGMNVLRIGLVHDVFGYWTLTKGKITTHDHIQEQAIQKVKKEIGVDVVIKGILGENQYVANKPEIGKVLRQVTYFLVKSDYIPFVLEEKGGLNDARWFTEEELHELHMYDDILPLVKKGLEQVISDK